MHKQDMEYYFYEDNFEALLDEFRKEKQIVLFLGAGINVSGDNRMDWNSLLDSLFKEAITFLSIEKRFSTDVKKAIDKTFDGIEFKNFFEHHNSKDEKQVKTEHKVDNTFTLRKEEYDQIIKEMQQWSYLHKFTKNEFPPLVKASIIKEILGKNYISSIQNFLYSKCNKKILKEAFEKYYLRRKGVDYPPPGEFYTLYQLARLILFSSNVRAVVTYNFDNLLTEAINILSNDRKKYFYKKEINDIVERNPIDKYNTSNDELDRKSFRIYHIHGYIPPPTELFLDKKNEIVLSMEEYYDNFGNLLSWQTSSQLHFLSNYTCIFAGLSLSDITPQRMVHIAHEQNKSKRIYYLKALNIENDDSIYSNAFLSLMNIKNSFHANYGLSPIFEVGKYEKLFNKFNDIFDIVKEIQIARRKQIKNEIKENKNKLYQDENEY